MIDKNKQIEPSHNDKLVVLQEINLVQYYYQVVFHVEYLLEIIELLL
jgi:hypothetical protein